MKNSTLFFCRNKRLQIVVCIIGLLLIVNRGNTQAAVEKFINNSIFASAHIGLAVYEPATDKYIYSYQSQKNFIPASNLKIFTCYAAIKNLEDSLTGLFYTQEDSNFVVQFSGDPTLLHADFKQHPVIDFFTKNKFITVIKANWDNKYYGNGWAWDDFEADYMPELSTIPIYGNTVQFLKDENRVIVIPRWFKDSLTFYGNTQNGKYNIERNIHSNQFKLVNSDQKFFQKNIPFITSDVLAIELLQDTIFKPIDYTDADVIGKVEWHKLKSQPTDTVLKYMMQRSDNFYAEQLLLMIGNEKFKETKPNKIINSLLQNTFNGLPQKIRWEDGSGLSRYNLVTPEDIVWVLTKMKNDIGAERVNTIFPTGNQGTLKGMFKNYTENIFAKTGSLSNNFSLSGYIKTKSNKDLVFSILINNHQASTNEIKNAVEQFLINLIEKE
ncbi:MAG TPA: D-alanyl-D-alanine carboxypeptidase/D-alanyl-D-alanine-endopeptidase [Chitinophagaceae bacterium]|nr:D-alanyl-D-alanine carboxypeptidase/D-alanyl-D-alanine-endopeptidase [Chitinophagaceae bacterium]